MDGVLATFALTLDWARTRTLRVTLSQPWLASTFKSRARRLLALYVLAFSISLAAALFFPLALLLVGPIVYGVPHLFSSLRYVNREVAGTGNKGWLRFFTTTFVLVSIARLVVDLHLSSHPLLVANPALPEIVALMLSFAGCAIAFRSAPRRVALASVSLAPLVWLAFAAPLGTVGVLLLLHNLVGFVYWIAATKSPAERRVALSATLAFVATSALILAGRFDWLYFHVEPQGPLEFAALDYLQIGRMIFPWSTDGNLWFHGTIAYAFGQAMHYFVWMKAIPDQHHSHDVPTTFRQSLRLAREDFGPRFFPSIVLVSLTALAVWLLVAMPLARTIYFAVSAYHGYLEIAALGFLGTALRR